MSLLKSIMRSEQGFPISQKWLFLTCSLILLLSFNAAHAEKSYKIGVYPQDPFAIYYGETLNGISVDIWRNIAHKAKIKYTFIKTSADINTAIHALKQHKYDALIGAFSVTSERINHMTFSRPYFISRLGVISMNYESAFFPILKNILFKKWIHYLYIALFILILFSFIHARLEYKRQPNDDKTKHSIFRIYYNYLITFITANSIEEKVTTVTTRSLQLFVVLLSVAVFSVFVSVITTALMISSSNLVYIGTPHISTLYGQKLIVIKNDYADRMTTQLGIKTLKVNSFSTAIHMLEQDKKAILLGKYLELKHFMKMHPNKVIDPDPIFIGANEYAFAFPEKSPLLKQVNFQLLLMQEKEEVSPICRKYLNEKDSTGCII